MKRRTVIPVVIVAFLLLGTVVLAQSGGPNPPTWYTVEQGPALSVVEGTASGGHYHLTSLAWQVEGSASGTGYRLLGPASPTLRGNGCCCTYLPCVLRNH